MGVSVVEYSSGAWVCGGALVHGVCMWAGAWECHGRNGRGGHRKEGLREWAPASVWIGREGEEDHVGYE